MDPDGILVLIGVISVGGLLLTGLKMILNYRATRLSGAGRGDIERLTDAVEHLRDQVEAQRGEISELHDRVDFAERMLAKARGEDNPQLGRPKP